MSDIIIMVGLPASGKSTYISEHFPDYVVISNDLIVEEYAKEHDLKYNEAFGKISFSQVRYICKSRFEDAVKSKKNIVIDNTNLSPKSRRIYNAIGYNKKCVVFLLSEDENKKRAEKRFNDTGKIISDNVISNMKKSFVMPTKSEGFVTITVIHK